MFIKQLAETVRNKKIKFILIGEIHGIKENILFLESIINSFLEKKQNLIIGLEWPKNLSKEINNYIQRRIKKLLWRKWEFSNCPDGRISKEHLLFLNWLKRLNKKLPKDSKIRITCLDKGGRSWFERDKKMAENLLAISREFPRSLVIAIMGNFHARRKTFIFENKKYIPAGSYLPPAQTMAIKIKYLSGSFLNVSLKKIKPQVIKKFISGFRIEKSKISGFDYEIFVKKANPITILK